MNSHFTSAAAVQGVPTAGSSTTSTLDFLQLRCISSSDYFPPSPPLRSRNFFLKSAFKNPSLGASAPAQQLWAGLKP